MKILRTFLIVSLLLLLPIWLSAQQMSHGTLTYSFEITQEQELPAEPRMLLIFYSNATRTEFGLPGLSETITIYDGDAGRGLILVSAGGQSFAIPLTQEQFESMDSASTIPEGVDIQLQGESRDIAGFESSRYRVAQTGNEVEMSMWVARDVDLPASGFEQQWGMGIDGLMTRLEVGDAEGSTGLSIELQDIDRSEPADELFDLAVPEGHTQLTFEQFMRMQGGV